MNTSDRDKPSVNRIGAGLTLAWRLVKAFFTQPIRFGKPVARPDDPAVRAAQQAERQRQSVRLICRDLEALFELHVESRRVMRHLRRVEQALRGAGIAGLEAMPPDVLAVALAELERLVWDWSPAGLAELRSRIAVLLKHGRHATPAQALPDEPLPRGRAEPGPLPEPGTVPGAEVSEIDHEAFEELERSWRGQAPQGGAEPR